MQPLLYEFNEYGERVAMRTFQTTPEGDPAHVEDTGAKTTWIYDEATGGLLKKEYADGKGPEYGYNEAGQLSSRVWAREGAGSGLAGSGLAGSGLASDRNAKPAASDSKQEKSKTANGKIATSYSYDPSTLHLTKSTATDGTEVSYEYDADARLAKVTDATGTREFAYDLRGQVTKETVVLQPDPAGEPIRYEIDRSYTTLGQPETVHLTSAGRDASMKRPPAGPALDHRIEYAWNQHNQLASVKSLAGEFVYGYDANNPMLLTKMTGPAHEVETSYEPHRNLVTGVTNRSLTPSHEGTKGGVVSSYAYANDVLGRRETISQGGDAFAMLKLGENTVAVAYNDRSEVTGAVYLSGEEIRQKFDYDYDGIGNRRSFASEVAGQKSKTSYETNALNQYKKISEDQRASAVTHDLDGNLLEDARHRYTWDAENRLTRAETKDGSIAVIYTYDYQSRRTARTETKNPGTKNEKQKTTYYLCDGWNVVAEFSAVTDHGSGDMGKEADSVRYYTWGRDLSGSLQGAGGVGGLLAISEELKVGESGPLDRDDLARGYQHRFPAYDANGNVGQLLDESGKTVAAYAYDPFGNVTEMGGSEAAENPWRFSTKPVEAGTGWLYYGFRYYRPETGRWASRDPIGEGGGVNLYGFVGNQPTGRVDFLGFVTYEFEQIKNQEPVNLGGIGPYGQPGANTSGSFDVQARQAYSVITVRGEEVLGGIFGWGRVNCNSCRNPKSTNAGGIIVYAIPEEGDDGCKFEIEMKGHLGGQVSDYGPGSRPGVTSSFYVYGDDGEKLVLNPSTSNGQNFFEHETVSVEITLSGKTKIAHLDPTVTVLGFSGRASADNLIIIRSEKKL